MDKRLQLALAAALLASGAAGGYALGRCGSASSHSCPTETAPAASLAAPQDLPPGHPAVAGETAPALDEKRLALARSADCPYLAGSDGPKGAKAAAPKTDNLPVAQWLKNEAKGGSHAASEN